MKILEVENLSKVYGKDGEAPVRALDDVSLSVEKGEFIAIIGASGSGKSTLLHCLGGVDKPTSGSIVIDGREIASGKNNKQAMNESELAIFRRRNIGIVYQFYNLLPTLTVEENIMLPFLLDKREPEKAKLDEILEATGLTDRRTHLPSQLSGGQQQRASIGRALINDPALLLADEPTGNLDSRAGREVMELLQFSNKRYGQTLLVITHDEKIAMQADRVITISDGKIVANNENKGGQK
jgi:putative ABC transport system ATP-binding protein